MHATHSALDEIEREEARLVAEITELSLRLALRGVVVPVEERTRLAELRRRLELSRLGRIVREG